MHNNHFNLCVSLENPKLKLCSRKTDVLCRYKKSDVEKGYKIDSRYHPGGVLWYLVTP